MKVIVQAGGLGTRMKGLTALKPKVMISVFNKPILFHLFDLVKRKTLSPNLSSLVTINLKFWKSTLQYLLKIITTSSRVLKVKEMLQV